MKNKKDLPLIVAEKLAPFVGKETDIYYCELKNNQMLMQVFDKDTKSDFYFFIKDYKPASKTLGVSNSGYSVYLEFKPESSTKPNLTTKWTDVDNLDKHFQNWVNLIKRYNETPSFYDDPIIKAREEEYFTEFTEVVPEEEQEILFKTNELLQLDELFEQLKIELTKQINQEKTESALTELENIKEEISVLQENIHVTTKGKVFQKMASFYARLAKLGLPYIKKFGEEFQKEAFKKIISFGLSKASEIIDLM